MTQITATAQNGSEYVEVTANRVKVGDIVHVGDGELRRVEGMGKIYSKGKYDVRRAYLEAYNGQADKVIDLAQSQPVSQPAPKATVSPAQASQPRQQPQKPAGTCEYGRCTRRGTLMASLGMACDYHYDYLS